MHIREIDLKENLYKRFKVFTTRILLCVNGKRMSETKILSFYYQKILSKKYVGYSVITHQRDNTNTSISVNTVK